MRPTPILGAGLALVLAGLAGTAGSGAAPIAVNAAADVQRTAVFEMFGRDT